MSVQHKITKYHEFASEPQISTFGQLGRQGSRRVLRTTGNVRYISNDDILRLQAFSLIYFGGRFLKSSNSNGQNSQTKQRFEAKRPFQEMANMMNIQHGRNYSLSRILLLVLPGGALLLLLVLTWVVFCCSAHPVMHELALAVWRPRHGIYRSNRVS